MRISMMDVVTWFDEKLKYLANKFQTRTLDPDDIYQELVILASQHEWDQKPTRCRYSGLTLPVDPSHVNQFLNGKAINLWRQARRKTKDRLVEREVDPIHEPPPFNITDHMEVLAETMPPRDLNLILAKAFPPNPVLTHARRDFLSARRARRGGQLKMYVQEPTVFDKHIAEFAGVSVATVSRACSRAAAALRED